MFHIVLSPFQGTIFSQIKRIKRIFSVKNYQYYQKLFDYLSLRVVAHAILDDIEHTVLDDLLTSDF